MKTRKGEYDDIGWKKKSCHSKMKSRLSVLRALEIVTNCLISNKCGKNEQNWLRRIFRVNPHFFVVFLWRVGSKVRLLIFQRDLTALQRTIASLSGPLSTWIFSLSWEQRLAVYMRSWDNTESTGYPKCTNRKKKTINSHSSMSGWFTDWAYKSRRFKLNAKTKTRAVCEHREASESLGV